jgi:hypothetical protein
MVLQTGQEINELDSSGFATAQTTVFAGNLGGESGRVFSRVADPDPASGAFL